MENATQALLIGAGVLVGILILSLGIALMNIMGGYAANTQSEISANQIAQFNSKFLKYNGLTDLKIQDVITVKNYALENNEQYLGYNSNNNRAHENNAYIDVYYGTKTRYSLVIGKSDEQLLGEEMDKLKNNPTLSPNRITCEIVTNTKNGMVSKIYFYEN